MYTVEIAELPQCIVLCRRGVLTSYQEMSNFIVSAEAEYQKANPQGEFVLPPYCFVEYFSDGYQEKDIELEYFKAVVSEGKETANIKFRHLEKRKAVCVRHKGSFDDIRDAYAFAAKWIDSNGYKLDGNIRERYIDGPWNKTSEEDYVTEIQLPIVKRERDNEKRKLLVEEYKNREVKGGVYAVVNTQNGKRLVMSTPNIAAAEDRFNFAVSTNSSTMYLSLAEDWRGQNGEGFAFEILATLDKKDMSDSEYKEALKELETRYKG